MSKLPDGLFLTQEQHYFRNELNLDVFNNFEMTWDKYKTLEKILPSYLGFFQSEKRDAKFHQNNPQKNEDNIKIVSNCGHFEWVFSGENSGYILQTAANNPLDMGTYNYKSYKTDKEGHGFYDVLPYFRWENTKDEYLKKLLYMY